MVQTAITDGVGVMKLRKKTINEIADMICGNDESKHFTYRSSIYLTKFFEECGLDYVHDGSTRKRWVADVLRKILSESGSNLHLLPDNFVLVIRELMDIYDAVDSDPKRENALEELNSSLARDGFQAYYDDERICQILKSGTQVNSSAILSPQRAWTKEEQEVCKSIKKFMETSSEDVITEEILLPLFHHLGFQRITHADHKDKALEYGKDIWMKYILPTSHNLYFGVQVKKGTIRSSGKPNSSNIAELLSQIKMMLDHAIFDPEINKRRLVDHAIIVASGEITKQARNWLGEKLDASQRSQILFMEQKDVLDLFIKHKVPLPSVITGRSDASDLSDSLPF